MTTEVSINADQFNKKLEELANRLSNISVAMQGQAVDSALMRAADPIRKEAQKEVYFRTGRLYAGVTRMRMRIGKAGEIAKVGVTVRNRRGFKYVANRWHWEEFGFKRRKKALKPYFRPAYARRRQEAFERFTDSLTRNIRKAANNKLRLSKKWAPEPVIRED